MITPIHRIPQLGSGVSFAKSVEAELVHVQEWTLSEAVIDLIMPDETTHSDEEIVFDYAMQLRSEFGLPWAQSIRIASIFYFG